MSSTKNQKAKPQSIYSTGVPLAYAIDGLGCIMYPEMWKAHFLQFLSSPGPSDPRDLNKQKIVLESARKALSQKEKDYFQKRRAEKKETRRKHLSEILADINSEVHEISKKIDSIGDRIPSEQEYEKFLVFLRVKDKVLNALSDQSLMAVFNWGTVVDCDFWRNRNMGEHDLENSIIKYRNVETGKLLEPRLVLLQRVEVDEWLDTFREPENSEEWAERKIKEYTGPVPKKPDLFAKLNVEKPELSKRAFDSAWRKSAPEDWKKRGRKS